MYAIHINVLLMWVGGNSVLIVYFGDYKMVVCLQKQFKKYHDCRPMQEEIAGG